LPKFRGEFQKPCETVRPLEGGTVCALQIGNFAGDILGGEAARELGTRLKREGRGGYHAQQAHQQPMAVNIGMPIEAAIERGRQLARRQCIRIAVQGAADMVGIFIVQALERERGEAGRRRRVDGRLRRRGDVRRGVAGTREKKNNSEQCP